MFDAGVPTAAAASTMDLNDTSAPSDSLTPNTGTACRASPPRGAGCNTNHRLMDSDCLAQVTFRVKGKITDVQCRCDWWGHAGTVLPSDGKETGPYDCDLKSCASLAPSAFVGFEKHALQLGYHHAAIWYRYVIRMVLAELAGEPAESLPFVRRYFIAVDKKEWPSCCVYTLPEILLDTAERDLLAEDPPGTLPKLIACLASGVWPDAPTRKEIEVPKWMEPKGGLW